MFQEHCALLWVYVRGKRVLYRYCDPIDGMFVLSLCHLLHIKECDGALYVSPPQFIYTRTTIVQPKLILGILELHRT